MLHGIHSIWCYHGEGHSLDIIEFPGNKKAVHMFPPSIGELLHLSFLSNIAENGMEWNGNVSEYLSPE